LIDAFRRLYGSADGVRVFRAPGRVNLIGEHTDYNLGFVLPVALDLATYVATAPAADGRLRIHSEHRQESAAWPVAEIGALTPRRHWTDYPIGVAQELIRAGIPLEPANLLVRSTVPEGAGLSSSAALEVSAALAMLNGRRMAPLELARLCQRAERNFVGMPCGIMDQYISVFGEERAAICIDCRSLKHQVVRLPADAVFVAVNTMVKHELAGSAYKERTEQCAAAVQVVHRRHPRVDSLRDVTPAMFEEAEPSMPPIIARRARHVVTENARVVPGGRRGAHGRPVRGIPPQPAARLRSQLRRAGFSGGCRVGDRRRIRRTHDGRRFRRLHRQSDAARHRGAFRAGDSPAIPGALRHSPADLSLPALLGCGRRKKFGENSGPRTTIRL
jgi:galactokinase